MKLVLTLVCILGLCAAAAVVWMLDRSVRMVDKTQSEDNIRRLLYSLSTDKGELRAEALAHTGRNFVLATVASGVLVHGESYSIRYLWPPRFNLPLASAYKQVTWESLESRRFAHLTGYAGPINARAEPIGPEGIPLIADLTHPDGILVGFSSHRVAFYSWTDLGIDPPDGAVVVGPEARHPLLRALSND